MAGGTTPPSPLHPPARPLPSPPPAASPLHQSTPPVGGGGITSLPSTTTGQGAQAAGDLEHGQGGQASGEVLRSGPSTKKKRKKALVVPQAAGEVGGEPHAAGELGGELHTSVEVRGKQKMSGEIQRKKSRKKKLQDKPCASDISEAIGGKRSLSHAGEVLVGPHAAGEVGGELHANYYKP